MNLLIIDNGTVRIQELQKLLSSHTYEIVKLGSIDLSVIDRFDVIILSGSSKFPIFGNEDLYKNEIDLIKNSMKSIIGICLGFELIAHVFGAELKKVDRKIRGIIDISVVRPSELFLQLPNFSVFESHRWVIKKSPEDFVTLAVSKDGIEAFRHKNRKLYGFQFHPSVFTDKTCGDEIFNNLLSALEKSF
ncbi:GMP synthase [glutamine-hydrolyzing] [bacterium BMS3Abin15]|nr:GMP synthase [glutamine-hydrolyzing] [bacterium BMS3Abin15]